MKFLIALFAITAFAATNNPLAFRQDVSSSSLSGSFLASPQLSGAPTRFASVDVFNTTSGEVEVNCWSSTQPASVPGVLATNSFTVPSNAAYSTTINQLIPYPLNNKCWVRGLSGAISGAGVVELVGWSY